MCRGAGSPVRAEIVANRQLTGVDELVIFLSAKGLPHGEINTQLAEVYGSAALSLDAEPARGRAAPDYFAAS